MPPRDFLDQVDFSIHIGSPRRNDHGELSLFPVADLEADGLETACDGLVPQLDTQQMTHALPPGETVYVQLVRELGVLS